ncbi:MAG: peroxidase family protein [Myxococcota bacterium]
MKKQRGFPRWPAVAGAATLLAVGCPANDSAEQTPVEEGVAGVATEELAPVGAGFTINAGDLRFIFRQVQIAQAHAGGGQLLGPGPNQVNDPRLPFGLRTVDGSFNHLVPGQTTWGAADEVFPRMTTAYNRPGYPPLGNVVDPQPRIITNLIADQTVNNPAALNVTQSAGGECVDLPDTRRDPTCFIPNVAPDEGLSAPFNTMFTFFGQFFDHGLDLVTKGNERVVVPLQPDDPLYVPGSPTNFMVLSRATNLPGPDGELGTEDDIHEATNVTTPFVDQNQTYTSHPSHQVFLREYDDNLATPPIPTGRLIDGAGGNIGNWAEVKEQARTKLGIALSDGDVFNIPLLLTDPYGHFKPGPNGYPLIVLQSGGTAEGNPSAPITTANAVLTGHAFLDDIAHRAVPRTGLAPDSDDVVTTGPQEPGTYDDELLDAHFVTGDGRGNENIALTAVHTIFHAEHNRLAAQIGGANGVSGGLIDTLLTPAEAAAWRTVDAASGWGYGERIFQAARFVTEMQYQHLVFEEFARKLVPSINEFIGDGINMSSRFNPAIVAEFAHAVYRLGHSMLTDTISRERPDGTTYDIPLLDGFLDPLEFNRDGLGGTLTAAEAAGAIFQGGTRQVGNQIDEFVTEAVRNNLLGLPLDLGVLNVARGRSESIAPLNVVREELFQASGDWSLAPYTNWSDYGFALRNPDSLVNFIAAYGIHPTLAAVPDCTTGPAPDCGLAGRRAAALALLLDSEFMDGPAAETGVNNIDLWIGGLAERPAPFGSMLGPTFTFVFERQLENLQNEDRFYYLERLDGLNLLAQLEGNSFQELIQRNTAAEGMGQDVFGRPDLVLNLARIGGAGNTIVDDPTTAFNELDLVAAGELTRTADGTFRYSGGAHVIWNGNDAAGDRIISSIGDDSIAGGGGDDFVEGGAGNDLTNGGAGNDILVDTFGEDVIKGGPGDDAISGGPGPFDLLQGNEGNDFIIGGVDASEVFGGPGNDVIYMGAGLSESFGGAGDDWMEGTISPASVMVGDDNNQFQNDPDGGHDVGVAGPGDGDFDMEGGDDIMVGSVVPTHRFEGMLGFDWVTYRGETVPVDADMLVTGLFEVNAPLNELRDRFDLVEGLSGSDFDDMLRGDNRDEAILRNDGLTGAANGHVLTAAGIARINGLAALLPPGATEFAGGNIILGGQGDDVLEGRGGNDILDGDAWLNVQLRAVTITETVRLVDGLQEIRNDVFAGRISPSTISIVRSIVPATVMGNDTAVFTGPLAEYDILPGAGFVQVVHARGTQQDGTDTLRNIEQLQFADGTIPVPTGPVVLPGVIITSAPTTLNEGEVAVITFLSNDPSAEFWCALSTGSPTFSPCSSPFTSGPLADGSWTFSVLAQYSGGTWDDVTTTFTVLPDNTPPGVTLLSGPTDPTDDNTPAFEFSSPDPDASFLCSLSTGADAFTACTSPVTSTPLADGTWTFKVRAVDPAGNSSETSTRFTVITQDLTPPVVTQPWPSLVVGATLNDATVPVVISWSSTDASPPVTYVAQERMNAGAFGTVALPSPGATQVTRALSPANDYQHRVRGADAEGNVSADVSGPQFRVVALQESHDDVNYSGRWSSSGLSGSYGGKVRHSSRSGATASLTFQGRAVAWVSTLSSNRGMAEVLLDGVVVATVDTYSASTQKRRIVFSANVDPGVAHTLQVRVLGTQNSESSSDRVDIDAFVVLGAPTALALGHIPAPPTATSSGK